MVVRSKADAVMRFLISRRFRRASVLMACALGAVVFHSMLQFERDSQVVVTLSSSTHPPELSNLAHHSFNTTAMPPYPRWGSETDRISLEKVLQAVSAIQHYRGDVETKPTNSEQVVYVVTADAKLYKAPTPAGVIRPRAIKRRMQLMEDYAVKALAAFSRGDFDPSRFPHLRAAFQQGAGVVFLLDYGDAKFCLDDPNPLLQAADTDTVTAANLAGTTSLPIFTLSAPTACRYSFPVPNYQSIWWSSAGALSQLRYWWRNVAWRSKYSKAVWRGSPTGHSDIVGDNTRVQLCELAAQHTNLLDAKLTGDVRFPEAAHLHGNKIGMPRMQHYKAIVDVDGNSWSSRFGQLLCTSSVVLKVEPEYVDYFYPELRPFVHFVPIQADLSDLVEQTEFVLAEENERLVRGIVANANAWCRDKFTASQLQQDTLAVWDEYVRRFDELSSVEPLLKEYGLERVRGGQNEFYKRHFYSG